MNNYASPIKTVKARVVGKSTYIYSKARSLHSVYIVQTDYVAFELEDLKELNEFDRHIEHKELSEESIFNRGVNISESLDDYIIRKTSYEELMNAINQLSNTQRRRVKMYYFDELDLKTIAAIEKTSFQMISKSIKQAIKKLKKILSK